jgi:hypothetical protein
LHNDNRPGLGSRFARGSGPDRGGIILRGYAKKGGEKKVGTNGIIGIVVTVIVVIVLIYILTTII